MTTAQKPMNEEDSISNKLNSLTAQWTGIRPLLMHNGDLADPLNPFIRQIKAITDKGSKKMTEEDHLARNKLEFMGSLYWHEEEGLIMPSDNIERCIQLGAQKSRKGKDVQAVVFCTAPYSKIEYDGPKKREKLFEDSRFSLRRGVGVNQSRIIRVRPMIPNWGITFEVQFEPTIVNRKDIIVAMQNAGALVGLGDWRPKFGRFIVKVIS